MIYLTTKIVSKYSNKKRTTEQYVQDLNNANPTLKCLEEYVNARIPILHKCLICGYEWKVSPYHVLKDTGCPPCGYKRSGKKNSISHEQFMKNLEGRLNPYVKIVGHYSDTHTKIECECLLCGKALWITPGNLYNGRGCASCMNRLNNPNKTHEQFIEDLLTISTNIIVLSKYQGARAHIKCKCKICGNIWDGTPTNLLKGIGCPQCALFTRWKNRRPTTEQYTQKVAKINPLVNVIGRYIDVETPIMHQCKECGYKWMVTPRNALKYRCGCPQCTYPHGEQQVIGFLNKLNISYELRKTYNDLVGVKGGLLSYDFYLPDYNCLIEFQGEQHSRPVNLFGGQKQFKIQQEHDHRKREYAKKHGIKLLEIWYYDYDRIEEILKNNLNLETVETDIGA